MTGVVLLVSTLRPDQIAKDVQSSVLYDAFGMQVSRSGSTATPFGFVGAGQYQTDADSGPMLCGHRQYDVSVGRFISSDPVCDGDNWYAYCENGPLIAADLSGLRVGPVALTSTYACKNASPVLSRRQGSRWPYPDAPPRTCAICIAAPIFPEFGPPVGGEPIGDGQTEALRSVGEEEAAVVEQGGRMVPTTGLHGGEVSRVFTLPLLGRMRELLPDRTHLIRFPVDAIWTNADAEGGGVVSRDGPG